MEEYQRVCDALNPESENFQSANEYFINLKKESPIQLLQELMLVLDNQEIPFEERERMLPIFSAVFSPKLFVALRKNHEFDNILYEASRSLIQFFKSQKSIRDTAAVCYAKISNIIHSPQCLVKELMEFLLSDDISTEEIESAIYALSKNKRGLGKVSNNALFENFICFLGSLELNDEIAKNIVKIIQNLIKYETPDETFSSLFDTFVKCTLQHQIPNFFDFKKIKFRFNVHFNVIADKADELLAAVIETVTKNPLYYENINYLIIKNNDAIICNGHEEEIANLILQVIMALKGDDDHIMNLQKMLEKLSVKSYLFNLAKELINSEDSKEVYTAIILFDASLFNRPQEEDLDNLNNENISMTNDIAARVLLNEDPDVLMKGMTFYTSRCLSKSDKFTINPEIVAHILSLIESDNQNVSLTALDLAQYLFKFTDQKSIVEMFDSIVLAIQDDEANDEQINALIQSLSGFAKQLTPEEAIEKIPIVFQFFQEVIESPDLIYFSSTVGLLCELLIKVGTCASEIAADLVEIGLQLLDTQNESDGIEILISVLKACGNTYGDVIDIVTGVILNAFESIDIFSNDSEIKQILSAVIEVIPHIDKPDLLRQLVSYSSSFLENTDLHSKINEYIFYIFILIDEKYPEITNENINVFADSVPTYRPFLGNVDSYIRTIHRIMKHFQGCEEVYCKLREFKAFAIKLVKPIQLNSEIANMFLEILEMNPMVNTTAVEHTLFNPLHLNINADLYQELEARRILFS